MDKGKILIVLILALVVSAWLLDPWIMKEMGLAAMPPNYYLVKSVSEGLMFLLGLFIGKRL